MSGGRLALIAMLIAAVAAFAGFKVNATRQAARAGSEPAATTAQGVQGASFADLEGKQRPLAEWSGKLLVVNFWATWCAPCLHEIPAFMALQQRLGPRGLQFVGIALDTPEEVAEFVAKHGVNYPILVGEADVAGYMRALGNSIGALPYTVVFARDGTVLRTHQGAWESEAVEAALTPLL